MRYRPPSMGKKPPSPPPTEGYDPKRPVPFKAVLPWEDLVALKQEAILREMTIGDVILDALRSRMRLISHPSAPKSKESPK
jgi:hypothetical protein